METGYFYSKSIGLYVAREPLKIDARIINAAADCGLALCWDDEGKINQITFKEAIFLLQALGGTMLTVYEYWRVLRDAEEAGDKEMASELQSPRYAEWLNNIFEKKESTIEHVRVDHAAGGYLYGGTRKEIAMPYGHPGWFNVEEIDFESGLPRTVELNRERHATSWKYWSFCDYKYVAAAIRGWVTSVGKPSLDLGIPVDASYPLLLVRECRRELLRPSIDPEVLESASAFIASFQNEAEKDDYEKYYACRDNFLSFTKKYGKKFVGSGELAVCKTREGIAEILGILRVIARKNRDVHAEEEIKRVARAVFAVREEETSDEKFLAFLEGNRERLHNAVSNPKDIVFVTGHKNPDTDTVVSAIAEAYRNHLFDGENKIYIPVVQGARMPDEIERLLGNISHSVIFSEEPAYKEAARSGQARWIMVDHNRHPEIQKFAISIVDHHIPCEIARRQNVPKTIEIVGSTAALIAQRLYGSGITIPKELCRILYGATLMDTENRSPLKMTRKDFLVMDDLKESAAIESDTDFYQDLMSFLLNSEDAELLFKRDYKEDWTFFGFAVAKIKGAFGPARQECKMSLLERLVALAEENNKKKNLPLTFIKIVDYCDDNTTVNHERVYLIFNEQADAEFREAIFRLFEVIIRNTFKGRAIVRKSDRHIEFWGVGDQLSRKRIVPIIEPVVKAFNVYFFSRSTGLYVKRDFLRNTKRAKWAAEKCGVKLSWDTEGRINCITYGEAMLLIEKLGFTAPSLSEYWQIRRDALEINDRQMLAHLESSGFVEFLDTVIEGSERLVEKPEIQMGKSSFRYEDMDVTVDYSCGGGKVCDVKVPGGKPGLISPTEIDLATGLPAKVHSPNIYDDPTLWRYWSPDAGKNVATRGYIFLLGQPALDLKVHLSESFYCLGVRPCCRATELPEIEMHEGEDGISLLIRQEGEEERICERDFFKCNTE